MSEELAPILEEQVLDISLRSEDQKPKKMSGVEAIKAYIEGFDEMIKFMDFSFERAFSH
jgi:soluble cytochrome b562